MYVVVERSSYRQHTLAKTSTSVKQHIYIFRVFWSIQFTSAWLWNWGTFWVYNVWF